MKRVKTLEELRVSRDLARAEWEAAGRPTSGEIFENGQAAARALAAARREEMGDDVGPVSAVRRHRAPNP